MGATLPVSTALSVGTSLLGAAGSYTAMQRQTKAAESDAQKDLRYRQNRLLLERKKQKKSRISTLKDMQAATHAASAGRGLVGSKSTAAMQSGDLRDFRKAEAFDRQATNLELARNGDLYNRSLLDITEARRRAMLGIGKNLLGTAGQIAAKF